MVEILRLTPFSDLTGSDQTWEKSGNQSLYNDGIHIDFNSNTWSTPYIKYNQKKNNFLSKNKFYSQFVPNQIYKLQINKMTEISWPSDGLSLLHYTADTMHYC